MFDLTGSQRDILYVVAGLGKPHELAVKAELDERTNPYTMTKRGKREIEIRRDWENQHLETAESVTA